MALECSGVPTCQPAAGVVKGNDGRVAAAFDSLQAEQQDQYVRVLERLCRTYHERRAEGKGKKKQK